VFRLGYGRLGPTEARLALVELNAALALGAPLGFRLGGLGLTALDALVLGTAALMAIGLGERAAGPLRTLAAREPAGRPA